jgi:hypothetical protein
MNIRRLLLLIFSCSVIFSENINYLSDREQILIAHVQMCIVKGEKLQSNLNNEILKIDGMSSSKVRHFLNNLCSMPQTNYLEIGCWKGSTFIASMFGNNPTISSGIAIDNWSEYGGPKVNFLDNCAKFLSANNYTFHENDCFAIDVKSICKYPVNVYFYDGAHTELDQELAFTYYDAVFDDLFVAVVDDWNHLPVPLGTRNAFKKLEYQILFETVLPARWNGDSENWWNGLYIAVVRKP